MKGLAGDFLLFSRNRDRRPATYWFWVDWTCRIWEEEVLQKVNQY
jgi:hypothetical protein